MRMMKSAQWHIYVVPDIRQVANDMRADQSAWRAWASEAWLFEEFASDAEDEDTLDTPMLGRRGVLTMRRLWLVLLGL